MLACGWIYVRMVMLHTPHVQVGALAAENRFDYLVIESTGIGEPMQVRTVPNCDS